jgi:hypothetical protein
MSKRLTDLEVRNRKIMKVISKISKLENTYTKEIVESACARYKSSQVERRKAQKEYEEAEHKLEEIKKKLN